MTRIKLKYVKQFRDRYGKTRFYFRRAGRKRIPLPGLPGSAEFMKAYQDALAGQTLPVGKLARLAPFPARSTPLSPSTISAAMHFWTTNRLLNKLTASILEAFRAKHGNKPIAILEQRHIENILAEKTGKPAVQRNLLRVLRALLANWSDGGKSIGAG